MKTTKLISAALGAALFMAFLPATAGAADFTVTLVGSGPVNVHQGDPYPFELRVTNGAQGARQADMVLELAPVGETDFVPMERWTQSIPAGETVAHQTYAVSSRWFSTLGDFQIRANSSGTIMDTANFSVDSSRVDVPKFTDVTNELGVTDTVGNYQCGSFVAGAAWGDVDGDGDRDLYLPRRDQAARLWIANGSSFTEDAAARGVQDTGSGVATGAVFVDYDNDADQDLFVTTDGPSVMFRNDGTGHFEDATVAAGLVTDGPGQSASFGDYDNDGFVDLYIAQHARCTGGRSYFPDYLFHNNGDGTFTETTALLHATGSTNGAGFQAVWTDYDNDRDVDLFLANDFWGPTAQPNFLWRNDGEVEGNWTFTNVSVPSGMAISMNSMGIAAGDYDHDGFTDLGISNIRWTRLMRNLGTGEFKDRAASALVDRPFHDAEGKAITWGLTFSDLNNDTWDDLYVPSGRLAAEQSQPNEVFANAGDGTFLDLSAPSGAADLGVSRGAALNDYDGDGLVDVYVVNMDGQPHLFHNTTATDAHWVELKLVGTDSNRDACGAKVTLTADGQDQMKEVYCGGTSVASGSDKALHFGLGDDTSIESLKVDWPSGLSENFNAVDLDSRSILKEGEGGGEPPTGPGAPRTWRTWVMTSPDQLRLEPPPGNKSQTTKAELREVRNLQDDITPKIRRQINKWNKGPATVPWTEVLLAQIKEHRPVVSRSARILSHFHLALYDALVAADDTKHAYDRTAPFKLDDRIDNKVRAKGSSYVPSQAVMAGAAETMLTALIPDENPATFTNLADQAVESRLYAGVNYRSDVERGRELGHQIAQLFLTYGETDGHLNTGFSEPRPDASENYWDPTPPGFEPPNGGPVGTWKPWLMSAASDAVGQIPAPPVYGSPEYMDALQEVYDIQTSLTDAQKQQAVFWDDGPGTFTPPGHWNDIALDQVASHHTGTNETTQLFALLNAAEYDAVVGFFRVKFHYWSVRPVTGIRRICGGTWTLCPAADVDPKYGGDPANADHPDFLTFINTPNFPSYPSGHATFSGAAGKVLGSFYPDSAANLADMADEAANSRLLGGIHYKTDDDNGLVLGRYIAGLALDWPTGP